MRARSPVPNPCPESWDALTPEERGHFCATCQTKVWDLSSMTKAEADALVQELDGDLCVSYRERADGSVAHRPEPLVPLARLRARLPAAAGLSLMLAACTPSTGGESDAAPAQGPKAEEPKAEEPKAQGPKAEEPKAQEPKADPPDTTLAPAVERQVKGKWAPAADTLEGTKTEAPTVEEERAEPEPEQPVRKGKWKAPKGD